jgi:hypothetical protein
MAVKKFFNNERPELLFDAKASRRLDPRFTFQRDSIATYYDANGILRYAGVDQPRFDHDPATLEPSGMRLERPGKNWVAGDFSLWNPTGDNSTPNAGLAPDGSNTATL